MTHQSYPMTVAGIPLEVTRKSVKYLRIKIRPPEGRVQVSAPLSMNDAAIRDALLLKVNWIQKHRLRMASQSKVPQLDEYLSGEGIPFKGRKLCLKVIEQRGTPEAVLQPSGELHLRVKIGSDAASRKKVLETWYRKELKAFIPPVMDKWQWILGVEAKEWRIKRMKTRWGSCNVREKRVWINLELVKYPPHLLEFIVAHELTHLLEPSHNSRFKSLMDLHFPDWRQCRKELKQVIL